MLSIPEELIRPALPVFPEDRAPPRRPAYCGIPALNTRYRSTTFQVSADQPVRALNNFMDHLSRPDDQSDFKFHCLRRSVRARIQKHIQTYIQTHTHTRTDIQTYIDAVVGAWTPTTAKMNLENAK